MNTYVAYIYDIRDLQNKKLKAEIHIEAIDKSDAQDKAHTYAFKHYGKIRHYVEIRSL
jgi:hypothetical protein